MEGLLEVLSWPMKSLEGVAFLEGLIFLVLIGMCFYLRHIQKDGKGGRAKLHSKVDEFKDDLNEKVDTLKEDLDAKLTESTDKIWEAIHEHESKCAERHSEDMAWKAKFEERVDNLKERTKEKG